MKINYLIKALPFLSTLFIIIFLSISNNKERTRLRLLIWNTPELPLVTYLALSTGTGFLISYVVTTNLATAKQPMLKKEIKYTFENKDDESRKFNQTKNYINYDNTLIERDIKEPSPTINASFRVIGKINRKEVLQNNDYSQYEDPTMSDLQEEEYLNQEIVNTEDRDIKPISDDWNDNSYVNW